MGWTVTTQLVLSGFVVALPFLLHASGSLYTQLLSNGAVRTNDVVTS